MDANRVWSFGRDSYIRLYPNPGIGLRYKDRRVALSWWRGFEIFERQKNEWRVRLRRFNRRLDRKAWSS